MGKGRRKNKRKKGKKGQPLSGVAAVTKHPLMKTLAEGGLVLLTVIASGGAGAALGKHSLIAGVPVTLFGIHKKNKYIIAAGLGLAIGSAKAKNPPSTTQGVNGFDFKQITGEAKDRVGEFFKNFSEKLYLPVKEGSPTSGLDGEQVSYFVNPYSNAKEIDMSALDRIQEQIAEMTGASGLNAADVDREF